MAKIKVYSTPACPYCQLLKEYLKNHGIEFEDLDVSQDQQALQELQEKSGALAVPVLDVDGEIIIGFDKEKIDKLLNLNGE
ncbi:glutathione S-transferase N-terminal domain-containing protein [bacterium]|nr:glutathione S-transferase N-terminal domain-containing protein [bacterium]